MRRPWPSCSTGAPSCSSITMFGPSYLAVVLVDGAISNVASIAGPRSRRSSSRTPGRAARTSLVISPRPLDQHVHACRRDRLPHLLDHGPRIEFPAATTRMRQQIGVRFRQRWPSGKHPPLFQIVDQGEVIRAMAVSTFDWEALQRVIAGDVVFPGSAAYDKLPKPFNARFHDVRPRAIVRCATPHDVAEAVLFVGRHGLECATRGGSHCRGGVGKSRCGDRRVADGCGIRLAAWPPSALAHDSAGCMESLEEHGLRFQQALVRRWGWLA